LRIAALPTRSLRLSFGTLPTDGLKRDGGNAMDSAIPRDNPADPRSRAVPSIVAGYVLAAVAVAAALVLTFVIRQASGNPTFFLFYVAIFISAWFGGRGPGWLATALAGLALHLLFRNTGDALAFTGEKLPTLLAFITSVVTADILSTQRHRAERALRAARDRLEIAVQDRTAELRRANAALSDEITERMRAESAVRASEERWRRLFEASSAGMALNDLSGRYIATNPAFQTMLGYTDDELKTLTAVDITHPDDKSATERVFADYVSGTRQENHIDKRYLKKDGTPVWVNVTSTFVPATDSSPPMLQGIYINIDDRKRAEQALRVSEERWRTVFETSSVGIATSDENLHVATANAAFQRMVGYNESELRQMRWIDLTHEDDRGATDDLVRSLLDGQLRAYNMEKRYRRKDGETIWVNVYNTHVPATTTSRAFFPAIIIDITDRVNAQAALERSQAELARVARVTTMCELATSIAHEINQPLAAIVASSNACRRWLESQNLIRARESLERVISDADRACEVIKRVRSLTSNAAPERVELSINVVLKEVLAIARSELQAKQILLQQELNDAVPAVVGDKVQLQQVVLNLVMNAIDAMAAATDRRRILTIKSQYGDDGEALVTVRDCGAEIDPANTERIFQAFFTTKPGGMGMGLSISNSIMEAHGGRLWASPVDPCGTAFHFTLPGARN
jgi:PAS domain S-box-containing protein